MSDAKMMERTVKDEIVEEVIWKIYVRRPNTNHTYIQCLKGNVGMTFVFISDELNLDDLMQTMDKMERWIDSGRKSRR